MNGSLNGERNGDENVKPNGESTKPLSNRARFNHRRRERHEPERKPIVLVACRWSVRAYGRHVGSFAKEHEAYRVSDEYRWLGVAATVVPTALRVSS